MKKSLLFVACMLLVMASCKKDDETNTPQTQNPMTENTMSETESKIVSFIEKVKNHENGEKSNETMSYDEAVVLLENTLNYCHSFTSLPKENIQFDTIYMKINGVNDNAISVSDAVYAYNSLIEEVREVYSSVELTDKKLHYVMVDDITDELAKDSGREVEVVVMTGRQSTPPTPNDSVIEPEEPWYEWRYFPATDCISAADSITAAIKEYDIFHGAMYIPCPNCYTYVYNYEIHDTYSYPEYDWLYYGPADYIMSSTEIYNEYKNTMLLTHYENMLTNPYYTQGYYETIVKAYYDVRNVITHVVKVVYATREWRVKYWEEEEFPQDIITPSN